MSPIPPDKTISDSQALAELTAILKKPYMTNCHHCEGRGSVRVRNGQSIAVQPCQRCKGAGTLKIQLI